MLGEGLYVLHGQPGHELYVLHGQLGHESTGKGIYPLPVCVYDLGADCRGPSGLAMTAAALRASQRRPRRCTPRNDGRGALRLAKRGHCEEA